MKILLGNKYHAVWIIETKYHYATRNLRFMYLLKSKTPFLLPPTSSKSFIQQITPHFYTDNMQKNTDIYAKHNGFMHHTATAVLLKQHSDSQKMPCCSIKFLLIKCSNHQEELYFYKIYTCYFLFDGFPGILNQHITSY